MRRDDLPPHARALRAASRATVLRDGHLVGAPLPETDEQSSFDDGRPRARRLLRQARDRAGRAGARGRRAVASRDGALRRRRRGAPRRDPRRRRPRRLRQGRARHGARRRDPAAPARSPCTASRSTLGDPALDARRRDRLRPRRPQAHRAPADAHAWPRTSRSPGTARLQHRGVLDTRAERRWRAPRSSATAS